MNADLSGIKPDQDTVIVGECPYAGILKVSESGTFYLEKVTRVFLTPSDAGNFLLDSMSPEDPTAICLRALVQ